GVHTVDQVARVDHVGVAPGGQAGGVDPIRPGLVLPAPLAEPGIYAADPVQDGPVDVEHVPAGGVVGDVAVVAVQHLDLGPRLALGTVEDRHQVRLRRLDVRLPPAGHLRPGVIVEQEEVLDRLVGVHELQRLVLGASNADILGEAVRGAGDCRLGRIVHHNHPHTRGVLVNALEGLGDHVVTVPRGHGHPDPGRLGGPNWGIRDAVDGHLVHGYSRASSGAG